MEGKRGIYIYRSESVRAEGSTLPWSEFEGEVRFPTGSEEFVRLEGFLLVVAAGTPGYMEFSHGISLPYSVTIPNPPETQVISPESLDEKNSEALPPAPLDESSDSR